jgi:chitinase
LIGDFFTYWLDQGHLRGETLHDDQVFTKLSCDDTEKFIMAGDPNYPWSGTTQTPLIDTLLSELGNVAHLNRLTIFLATPNGKKGRVSVFTSLHNCFLC